ncbi:uncharacterized protein THITE_19726, partial [Thermothielavioides terrestris NRRL 8126]
PTSPKPIRRRMRMITSCLECRRRKLKCEKKQPCHNCKRFLRECVYLGPNLDEASQQRLTEIKEQVGSLERQLERDVAKGATSRCSSSPGRRGDGARAHQQRFLADDVEAELGDARDLQITPMVALDLTYDDYSDGNGADDLIDLGIRVGKMRITERIGGLNRPRIAEEIQAGLADAHGHLFGAPSAFGCDGSPDAPDLPDFLKPGESYLPPTSGLFFGQSSQSPEFLSFLPAEAFGHKLTQRYFEAVHPIARCVHWPSFKGLYDSFWDDVNHGIEPRPSVQAVVFAAWFSAAVGADDAFCRDQECNKSQLVLHMKIGTETALSKAKFLSTTRFETLQAFIMYLVRRLVWHQLCFLDIRTCEAQGPKPAIRREDYDTKMPVNCEEDELTAQTVALPTPADKWTSMLLPIIRFEINEMMRTIWTDRRKLEMRRTTLTAMLSKVENFRKHMFERFSRWLNDRVPIQKYAKLVMQLLTYRLHVMVLHPFHSNTANPLPDRLNGLLVMSGIEIIEIAIRLESNPMFRDWAWYLGAYQQYQIALLLATEIYYRPNHRPERIWPCLDWVFQLDPNAPREQKILQILTEIMSKTSLYMGLRRVRAPTAVSRAVPGKQAVKESPPPPSAPPEPLSLLAQSQGPPPRFPQQPAPPHPTSVGLMPGLKTESLMCPPGMPTTAPPLPPPPVPGSINALHQHQQVSFPPPQPPQPSQPPMVFAGVTNGEALWSLPPRHNNGPGSPENSSDGGSVAGQQRRFGDGSSDGGGNGASLVGQADTINMLFTTDPQTGQLSFKSFVD